MVGSDKVVLVVCTRVKNSSRSASLVYFNANTLLRCMLCWLSYVCLFITICLIHWKFGFDVSYFENLLDLDLLAISLLKSGSFGLPEPEPEFSGTRNVGF